MNEQQRTATLCALVSCALLFSFTRGDASTNPASRLATMDALVHDHAFEIDKSVFGDTADKVKIGNHFYSSKPPLLSVAGALIYRELHRWTGLSFRDDRAAAVRIVTLVLSGLPHMILLAYAFALLRWFAPKPLALIGTYACIALGSLELPYATSINNHTPSSVAVFVAFYYAFGLRNGFIDKRRDWILAGLLAGLAPTLDLAALFVSVCVALYLMTFDWRRTLTLFAPSALPPLIAHFALTSRITGTWIPVYLRPQLYQYSGSYWNAPTGIDALDESRAQYLWNILCGHHGLFSMTPVLVFALGAIIARIARRARYFAEALTVGGSLLMLVCFYTVSTKNYGGLCVGFRWFLPLVPLLMVFVADWLSNVRQRALFAVFCVFMLVGSVNAYSALADPWQTSRWDTWLASFG